jgi:hypothetical protein
MRWDLETLLPLALLVVAAVALPLRLQRHLPRTLRMVLVNLGVSALAMFVLGAVLMLAGYLLQGPGLGRAAAEDPAGALRWLARLGLMPAIVWLPILALTELMIAQKIAGEG